MKKNNESNKTMDVPEVSLINLENYKFKRTPMFRALGKVKPYGPILHALLRV